MKPVTINLLNALVLIAAGLYGYFGVASSTGTASPTALIPAAFGVLFIVLGLFWAKAPKVVSHVVVVLTLLLLGMCIGRFVKIDAWDAKKYIFLACIISNGVALVVFIKSFIDARKSRTA